MTAQIGEGLVFRGHDYEMSAEPLRRWLDRGNVLPSSGERCTALWRDYIGDWEIRDDRLYLTGLRIGIGSDPAEGLRDVFPGAPPGGVFADWCDDLLRVPDGEQLEYVHMGYGSTYERDLFLSVRGGNLILIETAENRPKETPSDTDWDAFTSHVVARELTPRLAEVFDPDEAGFLRGVFDAPDDATRKLVYADWLQERNDPRHELIRLHVGPRRTGQPSRGTKAWEKARARVLRQVKDWLWLRLMGFPLPRDRWGRELRSW